MMKRNRRRRPKPRSPSAMALTSPLFRMRKVKPLKGKASYKRRPKHRGGAFDSRLASAPAMRCDGSHAAAASCPAAFSSNLRPSPSSVAALPVQSCQRRMITSQ